jgi:hypothetical protein
MKVIQYHQCDWNKTNPTAISDVTMEASRSGATVTIPVGTEKRGYNLRLDLSVAELLALTAAALAAEAKERKFESRVKEVLEKKTAA